MTTVNTPRRLRTLAAVAATLLVITVAGTAAAAPPSNDDITNARVVPGIPYADGPYDTTEATTGATDPGFCFGGGPDASTVWYSFTPGSSGRYGADTFGSDYDTTLYVGTADGSGGLSVIECTDDSAQSLQSAVAWDAVAGTTYLLMVGTCCGEGVVGQAGGGGTLVFHVDVPPLPPTLAITVDGTGSFNGYGVATIRGSISCSNAGGVDIVADATQRVGRVFLHGYNETFIDCTNGRWSLELASEDGKFLGGPLSVNVSAFACGPFECAEDSVSKTVRLRH
jgi:hypothetical protein